MGYSFLIRRFNNKKGQGMLETVFAVIFGILLLGGIIGLWLWGNTQIVKRQERYNATRLPAGVASDDYTLNAENHPWPVYTPTSIEQNKVILNGPQIAGTPQTTQDGVK